MSDYDEDFDDDDYNSDYDLCDESFSVSVNKELDKGYRIVSASDIISEMNKNIDRVNEIFKIKRSLIRRLLIHFNWNPEKLIEKYYESQDDLSGLFKEAGIVYIKSDMFHRQRSISSSCGFCLVCYNDNKDQLVGMLCDHTFCEDCWKEYFRVMIMESGESNIQCMQPECSAFVTEDFILSILDSPSVEERYHSLIANCYIITNKMLKRCPMPDCGYCAEVTSSDIKHIECACKFEWCFECRQPYHQPLESCFILKKWLIKAKDESETNRWLVVNTKECPKCESAIEKQGGCNHMSCPTCSYEFCWICLGEWKPHGMVWYFCNKYVEDEEHLQHLSRERKDMNRYNHYYERYWNHKTSNDLEKDGLTSEIKTKSDHIQDVLNGTWIEAQFLSEALDVLSKCRQMLQYSYVLAFYLTKAPETAIFEENQKDLEHNTELLSGSLGWPIYPETEADLLKIKQEVQNRAAYCEKRRIILLDDVRVGYEKGVWKYRNIN